MKLHKRLLHVFVPVRLASGLWAWAWWGTDKMNSIYRVHGFPVPLHIEAACLEEASCPRVYLSEWYIGSMTRDQWTIFGRAALRRMVVR